MPICLFYTQKMVIQNLGLVVCDQQDTYYLPEIVNFMAVTTVVLLRGEGDVNAA